MDLHQCRGDAGRDGVYECLHHLLSLLFVGVPVGGDDPLIDPPGRLHLEVFLGYEERVRAGVLLIGEEVSPGVKCPSGPVERGTGTSMVPGRGLLDAL